MSKHDERAKNEKQTAICIDCKREVQVTGPVWGPTLCADCSNERAECAWEEEHEYRRLDTICNCCRADLSRESHSPWCENVTTYEPPEEDE